MKRVFIAWIASICSAASANAASVTVTSVGTPLPGATITLEIRLTVSPADGTDGSVFGRLVFPTSGIGPVVAASIESVPFPSLGSPYPAGLLSCTTTRCVVMNHAAGTQGPQQANISDFVIT